MVGRASEESGGRAGWAEKSTGQSWRTGRGAAIPWLQWIALLEEQTRTHQVRAEQQAAFLQLAQARGQALGRLQAVGSKGSEPQGMSMRNCALPELTSRLAAIRVRAWPAPFQCQWGAGGGMRAQNLRGAQGEQIF